MDLYFIYLFSFFRLNGILISIYPSEVEENAPSNVLPNNCRCNGINKLMI
jgi:hypothetical protein